MNITGLLRGLLGAAQPSDAKALELRVGQIVKGLVIQLVNNQDALMNIGGVQVRARLEAPLKQGELALLQVQPESVNGQPVLKPLSESHTPVSDSSLPKLLKAFGLKDDAGNRQLIRSMEQEFVPLTKEAACLLSDALKVKPDQADPAVWTRAAALALNRGLPSTEATVAALWRVLEGAPLYELVQTLGRDTESLLQDPRTMLPEAVKKLLQQLADSVRGLVSAGEALAGGAPDAAASIPVLEKGPSGPDVTEVPMQVPDDAEHWIGLMLKELGVGYEREIMRMQGHEGELQHKLLTELADPPATLDSGINSGSDFTRRTSDDTLKGLLLQLVRFEDVPGSLKTTMQEILQQITGQQLLLTTDSSTPIAHVTLFFPFRGESGEHTASVHIQARRGGRGQLDAQNCRLLFDLYMQHMGNTLLDVQVVDRVVSLNVHNDHSSVPMLVEAYRDEMASSLQQAGYQLLSLKCSPYPTHLTQTASAPHSQLKSLIQMKRYKGVDIKA